MASKSEYVIETEGLKKSFGDQVAVDGVDLRVPRGSAFGYLGPNGAGKTTLIRVCMAFERPNAGRVEVDGALASAGTRRGDRRGARLPQTPERARESLGRRGCARARGAYAHRQGPRAGWAGRSRR
jgi:ABC-type multidrug transport system ATPase subunit